MPHLSTCPSCNSFIPEMEPRCPNCEHRPRRSRRLGRLVQGVVGGAAMMTLMACYGAPYDYEEPLCIDDLDCPTGQTCDPSAGCVPDAGCSSDLDCYGGDTCGAGGVCEPPGCETSGCPAGQTCVDDSCTPGCQSHADCEGGRFCDDTGSCVPSTHCGDGIGGCGTGLECDDRDTCVPCDGACTGSCYETAIEEPAFACPDGTVAVVAEGAPTGECLPEEECAARSCPLIGDEIACDSREECQPVYAGLGCKDESGLPCGDMSAICECESFVFAECGEAPPD